MIFIDAHNLIKRYYHSGGHPYSLFYALLMKYQNKSVEVVCDGPNSRAYRKKIHPGYKAGRKAADDPVYWEVYNNCIEIAKRVTKNRIIVLLEGEADDYIALECKEDDVILSNDKDLWPLTYIPGATILINATTKVDSALVEVKFNASAKHIYLYKAFVGDPSDKIPGKKGFGPAAWAKLDYEDRELYNHHFKIKNCSYHPEFMTEQACMSWELAVPFKDYKFEVDSILNGPTKLLEFTEEKGIIV